MAHPYNHAESSVRKYGGSIEDYLDIHNWFDESKAYMAHFRHRALRHHAQGIFECERTFGVTRTNSAGRIVPVRFVGEQHVKEDCGGMIPCLSDWFRNIRPERWMGAGRLKDDEDIPEQLEDLSMEAWRAAVADCKTMLGYSEWVEMRKARREGARLAGKAMADAA